MKSKVLRTLLQGLALPFTGVAGLPYRAANVAAATNPNLHFRKDGTFRILQLTDIHQVMACMDDDPYPVAHHKCENTVHTIEECIKKADPDLVIFTGDNISGYWEEFDMELARQTILDITAPIRKRGLPLAIVFGNHDAEGPIPREIQMRYYCDYENFLGCYNAEEMSGCGTYCLPILDKDSDNEKFLLWMVDSGDYQKNNEPGVEGYDHVHPDQLAWMERTAQEKAKANGGELLPSFVFQHITVPEIYDVLKEVPADTPNAVRGHCKWRDHYYVLPEGATGRLREGPCPPSYGDCGTYDVWKRTNVLAVYGGHDHVNDYDVDVNGIRFIQTLAAGYHTYGDERGGRLIVIDQNDPAKFQTKTLVVPACKPFIEL